MVDEVDPVNWVIRSPQRAGSPVFHDDPFHLGHYRGVCWNLLSQYVDLQGFHGFVCLRLFHLLAEVLRQVLTGQTFRKLSDAVLEAFPKLPCPYFLRGNEEDDSV